MQARVLHELSGQRTFVVVLRAGEELMGELRAFLMASSC
jgi:small nuclear ribonucleoprotein (snRNP)-like protein